MLLAKFPGNVPLLKFICLRSPNKFAPNRLEQRPGPAGSSGCVCGNYHPHSTGIVPFVQGLLVYRNLFMKLSIPPYRTALMM